MFDLNCTPDPNPSKIESAMTALSAVETATVSISPRGWYLVRAPLDADFW